MISFAILAALLALASVFAVTLPLLRRAGRRTAGPWAALAAAGVLVVGSALLVRHLEQLVLAGTPRGGLPADHGGAPGAQARGDPDNLNGWLMLGRSYVVLQEFPLALRAFERADRLSGGKNADALLGQAEALALRTRRNSRAAPAGSSSARWNWRRIRARRCFSGPRWPPAAAICRSRGSVLHASSP